MPSYMAMVVLALAASNVPVALSVPVRPSREVQKQSLTHRDYNNPQSSTPQGDPPREYPPPGYPSGYPPGYPPPGHPPGYPPPGYPATVPPGQGKIAPPKKAAGSNFKNFAVNLAVGTTAAITALYVYKTITDQGRSNKAATTSSTNQTPQHQANFPSDSAPTSQSGQPPSGQN